MKYQTRLLSILPLFCAALFMDAVLGQSLLITRTETTNVLVEAAVHLDNQYVLQGSANLHLWVDLNGNVSNQVTNRFDGGAVPQRYFRLASSSPPADPIVIVLLGDSTVADFSSNFNSLYGWGNGIYGYFKSNAQVVNLAMPGYSSKTFLASDEKARMITLKPNYVLVEFGLIDQFGGPDSITTDAELADNLRTIVQIVRGFNGIPILITPQAEKYWTADGKTVYPAYPDRFALIAKVAAELQTGFIDLNQLSIDFLEQLGESGSAYIWGSPTEYLHFSEIGAVDLAGLVVNALPDSLGPYLTGVTLDPAPKP